MGHSVKGDVEGMNIFLAIIIIIIIIVLAIILFIFLKRKKSKEIVITPEVAYEPPLSDTTSISESTELTEVKPSVEPPSIGSEVPTPTPVPVSAHSSETLDSLQQQYLPPVEDNLSRIDGDGETGIDTNPEIRNINNSADSHNIEKQQLESDQTDRPDLISGDLSDSDPLNSQAGLSKEENELFEFNAEKKKKKQDEKIME